MQWIFLKEELLTSLFYRLYGNSRSMIPVSDLIKTYFRLGLRYQEILLFLANRHRIVISMRTLKRTLSKASLFRRKYSDIMDVALFIMAEIKASSQMLGYKFMHLKCIQAGLSVTQENVRILLHILDEDGIHLRGRKRLRRRLYFNPGPDFMWHIDSYDKLKPYGICINGAIDGFSRQIIWLEANTTSSDPAVVSNYFVDAVKSRMGCPARIRIDKGTENGHIDNMQKFLRFDHADEYSQKSVIVGTSVHNQRIESWWGILRRQNAQFWMNVFQSLKDGDMFSGDLLDRSLVQFCFMDLIQVRFIATGAAVF